MKKNISTILNTRKAVLLSAIFFIAFQSCKKDGELYPDFNQDTLETSVTDTLTLTTELVRDDSIQTDFAGLNLLGLYNDPVFGKSSASFYSQITLSGVNINFGTNPVLDSAVLTLKYESPTGYYGNLNTTMDIEVYRLDEAMDKGNDYLANQDVSYSGSPIASLSFNPFLNDSIEVIEDHDTIMMAPHIRLNLDNAFGQEILDAGGNGNVIDNNTEFQELIKGIYVTPSTTVDNSILAVDEGSILYFDVNSTVSTVTLYYHNDTDTTSYSFIMNSESAKYNRFDHNYTGTDIENKLNGNTHDSTLIYIQALGGLKTKITIPHLRSLAENENIIINKAELSFTVPETSYDNYDVVETTALTGINDEGEAVFLADYFEGSDYFGGSFDSENSKYTFNISRHVQNLLNNPEEVDHGLYLLVSGGAILANRSVINSVKHPDSKIKLTITYSKL